MSAEIRRVVTFFFLIHMGNISVRGSLVDSHENDIASLAFLAQEDQKRIYQIERENKKLMERLAAIQRGPATVDCWNEHFQRR